ncbi:hypothetical protein SRABI36_03869 [Pedobacter sp. Bi36]|nr:hypothetical protein SRABI36_03869 [Pedobacter sp. Bi36]
MVLSSLGLERSFCDKQNEDLAKASIITDLQGDFQFRPQ